MFELLFSLVLLVNIELKFVTQSEKQIQSESESSEIIIFFSKYQNESMNYAVFLLHICLP